MFGSHATGDLPSAGGREIHIRVALYMWFCDHSEWWAVWVHGWGIPLVF